MLLREACPGRAGEALSNDDTRHRARRMPGVRFAGGAASERRFRRALASSRSPTWWTRSPARGPTNLRGAWTQPAMKLRRGAACSSIRNARTRCRLSPGRCQGTGDRSRRARGFGAQRQARTRFRAAGHPPGRFERCCESSVMFRLMTLLQQAAGEQPVRRGFQKPGVRPRSHRQLRKSATATTSARSRRRDEAREHVVAYTG
jgi:hypothetical protein